MKKTVMRPARSFTWVPSIVSSTIIHDPAIAARLNEQGLQSGEGKLFTARIVTRLAPSRL
jgi:hypothetical protein